MRLLIVFFFFICISNAPSQDISLGLTSDYSRMFSKRQEFSSGIFLERKVGSSKKSSWYINYSHSFGITNENNIANANNNYVHTSLAVVGWLNFLAWAKLDRSFAYNGGFGYLFIIFPVFIPTGVTYYFINKESHKIGLYFNPLCYDYWKISDGKEIDASNIEFGFKGIEKLKDRKYIYFSVGTGYLSNLGSKNLLPDGYSNTLILNFRLGLAFVSKDERQKKIQ